MSVSIAAHLALGLTVVHVLSHRSLTTTPCLAPILPIANLISEQCPLLCCCFSL